jgi:hypothetical protein
MAFRVHGAHAELRWGYYVAATLGAWTIEDQAFSATVREVDAFRIDQRPLVLVVGGQKWPLETIERTEDRVIGRVSRR